MEQLPAQDFWLTRDCDEGALSDELEVWLHRPHPICYPDGDVTWIAPLELVDRVATYAGTFSVAEAKRQLGNGFPETARECVHVARAPRGTV